MSLNSTKETVVTVMLMIILLSGFIFNSCTNSTNNLPYETAIVKRGNIVKEVSATGIINAEISVQVGSQVSGIVKEIYVENNSVIKKGQLLALIGAQIFEAQLMQAQANLEAAKALLEKTDIQLKEAELRLNRIKELFERRSVSRSDLDAAEASYNSLNAQKKAQIGRVAQSEGALKTAKVNFDHTRLISPIDGIVLSRNIEIGQVVTAALQPSTLFVIASNLRIMQIVINVSEADIGNIKVGQEITFTVDAYPDKTFAGKVKKIYMGPNIKQNIVYYNVIASVDNTELLLRPGMSSDVRIKTAHRENVLLIPAITVKQNDSTKYVEVWEANKIMRKNVTTGLKGGDRFIEVLAGLNEGEKVVVSNRRK